MTSTKLIISKRLIQSPSSTDSILLVENTKEGTVLNVTARWTPASGFASFPSTMMIGTSAVNSEFVLTSPVLVADPMATVDVEGIVILPGQALFTRGNPYSVRVEGFEHTYKAGDNVFGSAVVKDTRANNSANQKIFTTPTDKGAELDEFIVGNSGSNVTTAEIYVVDKGTSAETILVPGRYLSSTMVRTRRIPVPPNCDVYVRSMFLFYAYYQWLLNPIDKRIY